MERYLGTKPWLVIVLLWGCTGNNESGELSHDAGATRVDGGLVDAGRKRDASQPADATGPALCEPPDLIIVLDRTGTMKRRTDGEIPSATDVGQSKLHQALLAVRSLVTQPHLDETIRFGLEFFPPEEPGCQTLSSVLDGASLTNSSCANAGQMVVRPDIGTGSQIATMLDPNQVKLCTSTPTGSALQTAWDTLVSLRDNQRQQYLMLVTDGADFDLTCPDPRPMELLQQMSAQGFKAFLVGFGTQTSNPGGVNPPVMNSLACAGRTAKDFEHACQAVDGGYDAIDHSENAPRLYHDVTNRETLEQAMQQIAGSICCNCWG